MTDRETEFEADGPVVRDKRRIDPDTFEVRQAPSAPGASAGRSPADGTPTAEPAAGAAEVSRLQQALAERTADLQRLQAEYVNYKRRVDRDRDVSRVAGVEGVLRDLLSVLDDLRSARLHEELSAGFKAVAEEIERVTTKYGLEPFGEKGDAFDPHIHEALLHAHADGIEGPTCVEILQPGYRLKDKVIRPARVAVAEPSGVAAAEPSSAEEASPLSASPGSGTADEAGTDPGSTEPVSSGSEEVTSDEQTS